MKKNKLSLSERIICLAFAISLVFTSRALELLDLPLYYFLEVAVLGLIFIVAMLALIGNRNTGSGKIDKSILFTVAVILVMNVVSALMANINYGQSIIIGLLTFRISLIVAVMYFIFFILFKDKSQADNYRYFDFIINTIFILSLLITLLWLYLTYTLNAEYYYLTAGNLLVDTRSDGSYRFRFDIFFPFMLLCCSWFRIQQKRSLIFYSLTAIFSLIYIVFYFQGRVFIAAICLSLFLCNVRSMMYSLRHIIIYLLLFIFFVLSVLIYFTYDSLIDFYQSVLASFSLTDSSSLTRLRILRMMGKNFIDNFIMGNGYLSNQSDTNFGNVKFSPLDIGVLGVLYTFGFGIFIVSFAWFSKLWLDSFNSKYTKLYAFVFSTLFINTLFTGGFFFRPYQIMFLLLFAFIFKQYEKDNRLR